MRLGNAPNPPPADNQSRDSLLEPLTQRRPAMRSSTLGTPRTLLTKKGSVVVAASYVWDWVVLVVLGVTGYIMAEVTPNKRPFYLTNPDISFKLTEDETVPNVTAGILYSTVSVGVIILVCLVFVPGSTVPKGTSQSLIWRRKLWELHAGLLGLGLSVGATWFITNGMKNMFGKPRPDFLSRCQPDVENMDKYIFGGNYLREGRATALVTADICTNTDAHMMDDGFRSFPSAHSSLSSATFIYLTLFVASKFAVIIPFVQPAWDPQQQRSAASAFPSRLPRIRGSSDMTDYTHDPKAGPVFHHGSEQRAAMATRRYGAAPPIYLLVLALLPFFLSIFISSSRWFDYRHHGFDILFGYMIGVIVSIFSFRFYHLPISTGAGWAWSPRSPDRAFWAGVGQSSYATYNTSYSRAPDEEEGIEMEEPRLGPDGLRPRQGTQPFMSQAGYMGTHPSTEYEGTHPSMQGDSVARAV